jgi:hypothetical protein
MPLEPCLNRHEFGMFEFGFNFELNGDEVDLNFSLKPGLNGDEVELWFSSA